MHAFSPSYSGQPRNLVSALLVTGIHIAVVYALLVGLEIVPNPVAPPRPIVAQVIEQRPTGHPLPSRDNGIALTRPRAFPIPVPPPINIKDVTSDAHVPSVQGPLTAVNPPAGATTPARAVAATHTIPPYPSLSIRFGQEGAVRLKIMIDEQGSVTAAEVENSSGYSELDSAAIAWVKAHWRYQPAMQNGHAVASTTEAVVTFRLNQIRG